MIRRIHGVLDAIGSNAAHIDTGQGLTYEVLVPAFALARLGGRLGEPITLHTIHYLEGSSQSGNLTPRLAGFLTEVDREFFTALTSVKGIGSRKALRAMTLSTAQIAGAIADRDVKTLQSLPEIGRRMAETIIATLHGKIDKLIGDATYAGDGAAVDRADAESGGEFSPAARSAARQALEVLLQLGENRGVAAQWIDQVLIQQPQMDDPTEIVQRVLRLKSGQ